MAQQDGGQNGAAPVTLNDRPSPMDRVRQIQELQRASDAAAPSPSPAPAQVRTPESAAPRAPAAVTTAFEVHRATLDAPALNAAPSSSHAVFAQAQVNAAKLFGGDAPEVTGNPWKVIDFGAALPRVFQPPRPLSDYQAQVPDKALQTPEGLLFQMSLVPKDGEGASLSRVVASAADGTVVGAECKSLQELRTLFALAPAVSRNVAAAAFGPSSSDARVGQPMLNRRGGFEVSVSRGDQARTVELNNLGQPAAPGRGFVDLASYHLDRFEAAA